MQGHAGVAIQVVEGAHLGEGGVGLIQRRREQHTKRRIEQHPLALRLAVAVHQGVAPGDGAVDIVELAQAGQLGPLRGELFLLADDAEHRADPIVEQAAMRLQLRQRPLARLAVGGEEKQQHEQAGEAAEGEVRPRVGFAAEPGRGRSD